MIEWLSIIVAGLIGALAGGLLGSLISSWLMRKGFYGSED